MSESKLFGGQNPQGLTQVMWGLKFTEFERLFKEKNFKNKVWKWNDCLFEWENKS